MAGNRPRILRWFRRFVGSGHRESCSETRTSGHGTWPWKTPLAQKHLRKGTFAREETYGTLVEVPLRAIQLPSSKQT